MADTGTRQDEEERVVTPEVVNDYDDDLTETAEVGREQGLVRAEGITTSALAVLSDDDFELLIKQAARSRQRLIRVQREAMQKGVDWGTIPGTQNPTLLKPGAEILIAMVGGVAKYIVRKSEGDGKETPAIRYEVECQVWDTRNEFQLGVGYGACNTHERKYRYRRARLTCPECGKQAIAMNRKTSVYFCSARDGGCGKNFAPGSKEAKVLRAFPVVEENPDPWDLDNTMLKMAKKRAKVDAALDVAKASGTFTQDVEDFEPEHDAGFAPPDDPPAKSAPQKRRPGRPRKEAKPDAPLAGAEPPPTEPPPPPDESFDEGATITEVEISLEELKELIRGRGVKTVVEASDVLKTVMDPTPSIVDEYGSIRADRLDPEQRAKAYKRLVEEG